MKKNTKKLYLHTAGAGADSTLRSGYDKRFKVTPDYRAALPDLMDATETLQGADVPIQQVGVSNFKLPVLVKGTGGLEHRVEASITGTVSLAAGLKGINMSRVVRGFYEYENDLFTVDTLGKVLRKYRSQIGSKEARLRMAFSYPIKQRSLRSGLEGWQYYRTVFEGTIDAEGTFRRFIEFDFVYSSACPCSAELGEHARDVRGVYSIPHSQRSKARVKVEIAPGKKLAIEELHKLCLAGLVTETQVMVRREDEQAFAEQNGAHIKFVEDAARLLFEQLDSEKRIRDFQVACAHLESLHSHDAVSVICKGVPGGFRGDFADFGLLVC